MTFKEDIMDLLTNFVGVQVRGPVEVYYTDDQTEELLLAAYSLLKEYLGEVRAKEIISNFLENYPALKKRGLIK